MSRKVRLKIGLWVVVALIVTAVVSIIFVVRGNLIFIRPDILIESAIRERNLEVIKRYVAAGFDVRTRLRPYDQGYGGYTALHLASQDGLPEIVKYLLEEGADLDAADNGGRTPLMAAIDAEQAPGHTECVQKLILAGADVDLQDRNGNSALHSAAAFTRVDIVVALLNAGSDPNQLDSSGATPLHEACRQYPRRDDVRVVRLLLDAGADPSISDAASRTPRAIALQQGNQKIAALLLEAIGNEVK